MIRRLGVLLVGALATSPASGGTESPFPLCVSHAPSRVGVPRAVTKTVTRALYRHLSGTQRRELRDALEESVVRREARLNPFSEDLEDGDPDARLARLVDDAPEAFGVARALLTPRYCGTDGFCVRVSDTCNDDERSPRGAEVGRARFLAWPYAYAQRVRVDDPRDVERRAAELRRRPGVALVLEPPAGTTPDASAEAVTEEQEVMALFERLARNSEKDADAPGPTPSRGNGVSPWRNDGLELVAVPTLEAVANTLRHE